MHGERIMLKQHQFFSEQQQRPITKYTVQRSIPPTDDCKSQTVELFSSCSQLQIMFFLRDMWYELSGQEVPTDNEKWNEAKRKYIEAHS